MIKEHFRHISENNRSWRRTKVSTQSDNHRQKKRAACLLTQAGNQQSNAHAESTNIAPSLVCVSPLWPKPMFKGKRRWPARISHQDPKGTRTSIKMAHLPGQCECELPVYNQIILLHLKAKSPIDKLVQSGQSKLVITIDLIIKSSM